MTMSDNIKVRATQKAYYGRKPGGAPELLEEGDIIEVPADLKLGRWMEPVEAGGSDEDAEEAKAKPKKKRSPKKDATL
jgi:hypothetical protein